MDSVGPFLVIGGRGGLGFHITKKLVAKYKADRVAVFDIRAQGNEISGATYIQGDVSSSTEVRAALQQIKPRIVFHTASPMLMDQKNNQALFTRVNIEGTKALLREISIAQCVHALVYTSSSSVIHDNISDLINATEDMPKCYLPEQTEFYTHTKAVAEDLVLSANRKHDLLTVVIRGVTLFGERDRTTIPQMISNARSGRSNIQVGDGANLFDFTYLGNAAYGHILAAEALSRTSALAVPPDANKRVDGEVFVITNDEPVPFWWFVRAVAKAAGHPIADKDVKIVPPWVFYMITVAAEWTVWLVSFGTRTSHITRKMVQYLTMTRTFDISKAKLRLGYEPEVSNEEAIKISVDDYLEAECKDDKPL
jgi:sterol-4alpha-carboxylate 3-dehydrogenase (decarboxylating)